jgi:hypothetical protein
MLLLIRPAPRATFLSPAGYALSLLRTLLEERRSHVVQSYVSLYLPPVLVSGSLWPGISQLVLNEGGL